MQVYIPTRGRVGLDRQLTLRQFTKLSRRVPILVCGPEEVEEHLCYHSKVLVCPVKGIAFKRQWILENSTADIVVMADDDLRFDYRPDPLVCRLQVCTEIDTALDWIPRCVKAGFIHGGMGPRRGNPLQGVFPVLDGIGYQDVSRVTNFHFFDRKAVLATGVRFDTISREQQFYFTMEDFYMTLSLLTRGFPNRIIQSYVWGQAGSGTKGGCSLYRTHESQTNSAHALHAVFPQYVKVIEKSVKVGTGTWKGMETRTDVKIGWARAYRDSING